MQNKLIIFDMDGTLVDNLAYHHQAFRIFAEKYNIPVTQEFLVKINGMSNEKIMKLIFGDISAQQAACYSEEKEQMYREIYAPHAQTINGLLPLLDSLLAEKNVTLAIGSSAPQKNIDFILDTLNLRHYFSVIVGEKDVTEAKPSPEIFLTAAKIAGIKPHDCLVIEDSLNGIIAARRAEMKVVGITTFHTAEELSHTDWVIKDYTELTIDKLRLTMCNS